MPSKVIASADDDLISLELLKWSGLYEIWSEREMGDHFDFTRDVIEYCSHAYIEYDDWDDDMPGRSGTWHTVTTSAPQSLKRQAKVRLNKLYRENKQLFDAQEPKELPHKKNTRRSKKQKLIGHYNIWDDLLPTKDQANHALHSSQKSSQFDPS